MQKQLYSLWEIQALEQKKSTLKIQANDLSMDAIVLLRRKINDLKRTLATGREQLLVFRDNCEKQEAETKAVIQQYRQLEAQLYSGDIKNAKELEQLKDRCDISRSDIDRREEKIFYQMDSCDQLEERLMVLEKQLQETKRQLEEELQKYDLAAATLEKEINETDEKAQQLTLKVNPTLMEKYRELQRKLRFPIAKVEKGICSGCHRSLPVTQATYQAVNLVFCDNCGRILLIGAE